jgi:hypothetical protein
MSSFTPVNARSSQEEFEGTKEDTVKDPKDNSTISLLPERKKPGRKPFGPVARRAADMVRERQAEYKKMGWRRIWVTPDMIQAATVAADMVPESAEPLNELVRRFVGKEAKNG